MEKKINTKDDKKFKRHVWLYKYLRKPVTFVVNLIYNFKPEKAPTIDGNYILIANHTTNLDPLLVTAAFSRHMYFVASEHLFRLGILSKLLVWVTGLIPRAKGTTDGGSALGALRSLKKTNVCIFAEGNITWNGKNGIIHPTTARFVKASRAGLVTYRITGGFLTEPRWHETLRRGKMRGEFVRYYTPQELKEMSVDEVAAAINRDIFVDHYEEQRREMIKYTGKRLAEKLETVIYCCPKCGGVCTMHSHKNEFYCDCGYSVKFNEYGFFEGTDLIFDNVFDWDVWQEKHLRTLEFSDDAIYRDAGQKLYLIGDGHSESVEAQGEIRLYQDRLEVDDFSVMLDDIFQVAIHNRETIVFSANNKNYEIRTEQSRSGRKYMTMIEILTERVGGKSKIVN